MVKIFRRGARARGGPGAGKAALAWLARAVPFGAILFLLAIGLFASAHLYLSAWAEGRPEFALDRVPVRLSNLPDWAPRGLEQDIEPCVAPPAGSSLFTPGVLDRIRDQLLASPWVESVASVRAAYPNRVEAELVLRKPTAYVIDSAGGSILVDAGGVRLPDGRLPFRRNTLRLPRIDGGSGPSPAVGSPCADPGVREAAALAARLASVDPPFRSLRIASIDVRGYPATRQLSLWTSNGCWIQWGRIAGDASRASPGRGAQGTAALLEPVTEARKVEILRWYDSRRPGFHGIAWINVGAHRPGIKFKEEASASVP